MKDDDRLRKSRLVFYEQDLEKIDRMLDEFIKLSKSKCVLLIDKDGHMVTKVGSTTDYDTDTISALVAGSFAATKEMARILGEEEFSLMFHQGAKDNIQLSLVGERTIIAVIFDDRTTVGMVRLYSNEVSKKLGKLFETMGDRDDSDAPTIDDNFGSQAGDALDEMFGD
jgi:predicted regulator of Ras-like GTPase activity (Roadblock/LC7/MglB family)